MHNPLQQPPQDGFFTTSQLPASEPVSAQIRSNRFACKPKAYLQQRLKHLRSA
jgi:hypothetical protein